MQRIGWMRTDEFGWRVGNSISSKHRQTRDDKLCKQHANSREIIFMWSHAYRWTSTIMSHVVTSLLQPATTTNQHNNAGHHHNTSLNDGANPPSHHITPIPLQTNPTPETTPSTREGRQPPNKRPRPPNNDNKTTHWTQPPQNDDERVRKAPTTTTSTPHSPRSVNERPMWQRWRRQLCCRRHRVCLIHTYK